MLFMSWDNYSKIRINNWPVAWCLISTKTILVFVNTYIECKNDNNKLSKNSIKQNIKFKEQQGPPNR